MQNDKWREAYEKLNSSPQIILKEIIEKLKKGQMSAFIGAGFSKNTNKDFPDWSDLLIDLYRELNPECKSKDNKIKKIIQSQGESCFAQKYLDSGKHRETLDYYIENKINPIDKGNKWLYTIELLLKLNWNDVITTNWDTILEQANRQGVLKYEIVKSAKQLKNANHRRIIKINGTLRDEDEKEKMIYEFDGCHDHLYVITTDDFKTYSRKHEAFSNFMKVKFLEDSFCLFGFSGNDPNFKYWINEIKNIMTKGGDTEAPNAIFLINYDNKELSDEDKQFFYNNFVINIPLSKLIEELKKEEFDNENNADFFSKLFLYLDKKTQIPDITDLDNNSPTKTSEILSAMLHRKGSGFSKEMIKIYNSLPLFSFENLEYSNLLLSNVQYYFSKVDNFDAEDYLFLYRWCSNNFYYLSDIFSEDNCNSLINKFKNDILPLRDEHPFIELVFSYYRLTGNNDEFEKFYKTLQKTELNKNYYIYQKLLIYFYSLDYKKFIKLLSLWKPESDSQIKTLFIIRKIRLLYCFNTNFDDIELKNKVADLFIKAEEACHIIDEPCLYLFTLFYHKNLCYMDSGNRNLQSKIDSLKKVNIKLPYLYFQKLIENNKNITNLKPNEDTRYSMHFPLFEGMPTAEDYKYYNGRRILSAFDITGIPSNFFCNDKEYMHIFNCLYYKKNDVWHLVLFLLNAIPFFGNSADEEVLRYLVNQVFRVFDKNLIGKFGKSIFEIIKTLINKQENPKTYFYFITESLKRSDSGLFKKIIDYYFELINKNNIIFYNLVDKGQVWGIKGPFMFFLKKINDKEKIHKVCYWIIDNYLRRKQIEDEEGYWNPWYNYFCTLLENTNFSENEKKLFFQKENVSSLIIRNPSLSKKIILYVFNFLSSKDQEETVKELLLHFDFSIDYNLLINIKNNDLKKLVLSKIEEYIVDKQNISVSTIAGFIEVYDKTEQLSSKDYTKIRKQLNCLFLRLEDLKEKISKNNYMTEIEKWFYLLGFLENNEHYDNNDFSSFYAEIKNKYIELNEELFSYDWIYSNNLELFRVNSYKIINFYSITHAAKENINILNQILLRIVTGESNEFEGPLELFIKLLDTNYENNILENDFSIALFKQIQKRFLHEIPLCYDDLFINSLMGSLDKKLKKICNE